MSRVKDMIINDTETLLEVLIDDIEYILADNAMDLLTLTNDEIINNYDFDRDMFDLSYDTLEKKTVFDFDNNESFIEHVQDIYGSLLDDISKQLDILREKAEY